MSQSSRRPATLDDFFAIPEAERFHELRGGDLIQKAAPSGEHGSAQAMLVGAVVPPYNRKLGGGGGPGGWWIQTEVEVLLGSEVVRPDVLGWRRTTCPERPIGSPVTVRPDWICEVISASNAQEDTVRKLRLYHHAGVLHYWMADPRDATLTVMRHSPDGYIMLHRAERHETISPEPFPELQLLVGVLFGDDP
jgi:Uma2 family endonuclease